MKNLIQGALIASGGKEIRPEHLRFVALGVPSSAALLPVPAASGPTRDLPLNLAQAERRLIQQALRKPDAANPPDVTNGKRMRRLTSAATKPA